MWPSGARSTSPKQVSSTSHFSCPNAISGGLSVCVETVERVFLGAGLTGRTHFCGRPLKSMRLPTNCQIPLGYFAIVPKCLFYKMFHYIGFIEINMSTYMFKSFSSLLMFTYHSPTGAAYPAVSVHDHVRSKALLHIS